MSDSTLALCFPTKKEEKIGIVCHIFDFPGKYKGYDIMSIVPSQNLIQGAEGTTAYLVS